MLQIGALPLPPIYGARPTMYCDRVPMKNRITLAAILVSASSAAASPVSAVGSWVRTSSPKGMPIRYTEKGRRHYGAGHDRQGGGDEYGGECYAVLHGHPVTIHG